MTNDQIDQFKAFMDFIQNVDSYKDVIVSLQTATNNYNDKLASLLQGQTLAAAQVQLTSDKAKFVQDMQDAQDSLTQTISTQTQKLADQQSTLAIREQIVTQRERDADIREAQVIANEVQTNSLLADAKDGAVKLALAMADVQQTKIKLASQADQIKQLVS